MNYIKPEDIKAYVEQNPQGIAGMSEELATMVNHFAELIVKECMACSTWVGKMNTNSSEPIQTAHAINQRIKQHFGVEE